MSDKIATLMSRAATVILQALIVMVGLGVLAALLMEPQFEGRNVNATQFEVYFKDPFLAYIYLAFVPFFIGLYQAFKIVRHGGRGELYSPGVVRALRITKYCAAVTAVLILGAVVYLFIFIRGDDDIAGGVAMGVFIILVAAIIVTAAAVLERVLQ